MVTQGVGQGEVVQRGAAVHRLASLPEVDVPASVAAGPLPISALQLPILNHAAARTLLRILLKATHTQDASDPATTNWQAVGS